MNKIFNFMRESSTARFLIPLGIGLTIFGIIMFVVVSNSQNYIEAEATVSNVEVFEEEHIDTDGNLVETTYSVSIKYIVNEKEYEQKLENMSKYNIGDKIKIYYNPENPKEITQTKSFIFPIIIVVAGISSFTGGIISAINAVKKHKKMKEQERSWDSGQ
jgi:hypothetical protein